MHDNLTNCRLHNLKHNSIILADAFLRFVIYERPRQVSSFINSPRQDRYQRKRCACQLRQGFRPSDRSVGLARSERLLRFLGTVAGVDGACRQFPIHTMSEVYTTAVRGSLYGANERDWNIREERGTKLTTLHPCLGCVIVLISRR